MVKLWSDGWDYNEVTKDRSPSWKLYSRINDYKFILENGEERKLIDIINEYDVRSILDYGCGHSTSIRRILESNNRTDIKLVGYDPFIEGKEVRPDETFDMVMCHNVLGGIEKEYVAAVIEDVLNYSNKIVVIKIPTGKELIEFFSNHIREAKGQEIVESSIHHVSKYFVHISLSQFFVYFLLKKHEQTNEEYGS